ncbi:DUF4439 domain-containing protein [Nakamurella sp. A5-74]|uniref:DUF4439 domain-containing protein n=1 Tax=Nakamurella sp. A5-74 TaxID=3158264 RepID=A0AAU8DM08_9ACTN
MTAPSTGPSSGQSAAPRAGAAVIAALQLVLQAENAAIWAYALVGTADADNADTVSDVRAAHLVLRDAAAEQITQLGGKPNAPAAAYQVDAPADAAAARTLAIGLETDCAETWRAVVGNTDDAGLRSFASGGLSGSAVRIVRWRAIAKTSPVTVAFPGAPDT